MSDLCTVLSRISGVVLLSSTLLLSSCGGRNEELIQPEDPYKGTAFEDKSKRNTIFGIGGMKLFGDKEKNNSGSAIGVNSFLWRASLDTISFMPINSADPFGGVIITDWHTRPEAPNERFKLNIYILDRVLRADGVRVAVFRQERTATGWVDAQVPEGTGRKIEDSILMQARKIRYKSIMENN